jgi:hypothetical protein
MQLIYKISVRMLFVSAFRLAMPRPPALSAVGYLPDRRIEKVRELVRKCFPHRFRSARARGIVAGRAKCSW